ncbi:MAG TPA: HPF/RaiA family ribosome-associated protein [Flavobacterium sp.]|jgi:ribosome-associated translation inhibitor RaiA
MHIQFSTNNNIEGYQRMADYFSGTIEESLKRFDDKITGIYVHLGDENSDKSGSDDKKCSIETRLAGLKPVAAVHHADTIEKAIHGATDKMKRVLEHTLDKMRNH